PPAVEPEGPVITINRFGKGIAIYCVPPIFTAYQQDGTPGRRCLIAWMLDQVYPAALRSIVLENAPSHVELTYQSRGHDRFVHLVNFGEGRGMSGPQRARNFRAVHDIRVRACCTARPRKISLMPERYNMNFEWRNGSLAFTARPLQIQSVYMIEGLKGKEG